MIEILKDKTSWNNTISLFEDSDVYHTFEYHDITKENAEPVLIKYTTDQVLICLPLLIRKIPDTTYYDATSVYGYSGPLCKGLPDKYDNTAFSKELLRFFVKNKIVSVFSRLNPFIKNQHQILDKIGDIVYKGSIVSIDLKKSIDEQRAEFRKRLKGQLNKSRRSCIVKQVTNDKEFQDFVDIYHENMDRVNAKAMYYFNEYYYQVLSKSNSFNTETFLAINKETGRAIGASMFIYKNHVIHYHLSGTRDDSLHLMPNKLLIDEMRIRATELGLAEFNLGGGLGSANDSLLQFKSSFSKNLIDFHVWKLIVLPNIYAKLTRGLKKPLDVNFFPSYRFKNN